MSSINRPPHVLKREKTLAIPRHFIFFDTETIQQIKPNGDIEQIFKLGWCVYYRRPYCRHLEQEQWFFFDNIGLFWDFVFTHTERKQRLWIMARNVVFDFTVCNGWYYLKREGYKLKFFHNNGVSAIVSVQKKGSSIVFLDTMNWFVESIEATGERIGIPKIKIDFKTCTYEQLKGYCRNDVRIDFENFKQFIKFLESNMVSRLCYTKASTAMAAYLFKHYHTPIFIHNNAEAIKLERHSYKGGRCECFYLGELKNDKYYILDVNSLYPFVMRNNSYPVKYVEIVHNTTPESILVYARFNCLVAKVRLRTEEAAYAVKADRTLFPVGEFVTTLCTPELIYALEHNHIQEVFDVVVYDKANIFTSYVDSFYALRMKFKDAGVYEYERLCKVLLNSLYGKFGQKGEQWEKIGDAPDEENREEIIFRSNPRMVTRIRYLLGEIFELKGYTESFNSFPAIAAHVTAYGRMHLYKLMKIAGVGNYFYCDTDSLIVNEVGKCRLINQIDKLCLGGLKIESDGSTVVLRGLKDYSFNVKNVTKGIRKNALKIAENTYCQEQWPSFKTTLRSGSAGKYTVKHVIKHLTHEYTKGIVTKTGWIEPYRMSLE